MWLTIIPRIDFRSVHEVFWTFAGSDSRNVGSGLRALSVFVDVISDSGGGEVVEGLSESWGLFMLGGGLVEDDDGVGLRVGS